MHALMVPSERNMLTRMAVIAAVALLTLVGLGGCPRPDTMMNDNASNDNGAATNSNDNGSTNENSNSGDNANTNDNTNTNDNVNANDNSNANDNGNSNGNSNSNANANANDNGGGPVTMPIIGTFSGTISCVKTEDSSLTNPTTSAPEIRMVTVVFDANGQPVTVHIENLDNFSNPDFDADIQVAGDMDSATGNSDGMHLYMTTATVASADYSDNALSMTINLGYAGNRTTGIYIENGAGTQTVDFTLSGDMLTYHFFTTWHMDATTGFGPFSLDQTFDCTGTLMRQ